MISVHDHLAKILDGVGPIAPIDVALADAVGCILADDLVSDIEVPRAASAAYDGYAVFAVDTEGATADAPVRLPVAHDLGIADGSVTLVDGTAVRLPSGTRLPAGADAVVPLSATDRGDATVAVSAPVAAGEGVRGAGIDVRRDDVLVPRGTRLGARQLALAAAMGRGRLTVHPRPRVVILSVGDELVTPGARSLADGSAYDANAHALTTAIADAGGVPLRVGVVGDDRVVLRDVIEDQLMRADLMITTGGLESESDTVKDVLAGLGTVDFEEVAVAPGRRHGFGTVGDDVPIFALPGHPVAAQVAFEVFVRPALRLIGGHSEVFRPSVRAVASEPIIGVAGKRTFLPAEVLGHPDEGYSVRVLAGGDLPGLTALAQANSLAVVPEQSGQVREGGYLNCMVLE